MTDAAQPRSGRVRVAHEADVPAARQLARAVAAGEGMSKAEVESLATAVTEIARNIVVHGGSGEVAVAPASKGTRRGVEVVARDAGSGIADLAQAMRDGFSTGKGLGLGLPSARRLVDEFEIESSEAGTKVTMRKWANTRPAKG
jgi:serine/threonine-protein kinase RsbT